MTTTTRQFEDKLIKFINSYYNTHHNIENLDKIRMASDHITVYINTNKTHVYHVTYGKFSEFNY